MAFPTISGLFFTFLLFSTQINARESYSFGKQQRDNPKDQNPSNLQANDTNEQDNQNPDFIPQTGNGYGLYGHETTTTYNNNEELNDKKYEDNVNYDDSFSTPSLSQTQQSYKNYDDSFSTPSRSQSQQSYRNYDDSFSTPSLSQTQESYKNYEDSFSTPSLSQTQESYKNYEENYPKTTESYDSNNKDTSYFDNSNSYRAGKEEKDAYKGYSNNVERQGMSDTRFMANGNYYYDLDDDRNHGRFYQKDYYNNNNYKPTGYNQRRSSFNDAYNSKHMMNQHSQMFGDEQADQFTP